MKIGILKEKNDNRVAITPDTAGELKKLNIEVLVEPNAGSQSFFSDEDYINKGSVIAPRKEIFQSAEILLFINPLEKSEIMELKPGSVLIGMMNPFFNTEIVGLIIKQKLSAFSLDVLPRISRAQSMDVLSSMATVSGYQAVIDAARLLPKFFPMFMSAAGTIKPAKMLVLGAGVAGLQALAIARKLGAIVEVFDVRAAVKEEVKSLGGKFIEVEGATEDKAAGGYAVEQTAEFKQKQGELIHRHAVTSDIIISTAQIQGKKAPLLIKKETVELMKPGSVIIDLAASTGGNCELTRNNENIVYNQVKIIGKVNYPSEMPTDASSMFSKNMYNFLTLIIDETGNIKIDFEDEVVKTTCVSINGEIKNTRLKELLQINA